MVYVRWKEVKSKILIGVKKCYISDDLSPEFDAELAPEKMDIDKKAKKEKKKIITEKNKSPEPM